MAFRRKSSSFSSRGKSGRRQQSNDFEKVTHKEIVNPLEAFTLETLPEKMREVYKNAKWDAIMPVQAQSMPYLLANRDIMVQSRTGSGKTASYLVPLIEKLDLNSRDTQALVLVPTRELALQVQKEAYKLFMNSISTLALYGGVPYTKQLYSLKKGMQLVVGTPGRILDHLQRGTLNLDNLEVLVFDEADRMLSIGFYPDMKALQEFLPEKDMLATLFSATYPANVLKLAEEFLKEPDFLSLSQGHVHITEMAHYFVPCKKMEKDRTLVRLLEIENPSSGIIFCNTKATVHYVTQVLQGFGYNAEELSSEISQSRREFVLSRLRNGQTRFLVATDVAARGIDVPLLSHVFLYEPPEDKESYIHRAGRTARAGASGTVISLADTMERMELQRIAKFYTIELEQMDAPTKEDVERVASARVVALLEQKKRELNGLQKERISNYISLVEELTNPDVGSEEMDDKENIFLLAMLLDEVYQKSLNPEPERPTRSTKSHTRGARGSRNDRNARSRDEDTLTAEDSLDSMRDGFQESQRQKYGNRGPRNARNRNEAPSRTGREEGRSRNRYENDDRAERPRSSFNSRFGSERYTDDRPSRPNRGFDPRHQDNNDDDIFGNDNASKYNRQSRERSYAPRETRDSRPSRDGRDSRDARPMREERSFGRDSKPSYGADSFPRRNRHAESFDDQRPSRGRNQYEEQEDYVVFKDDNFFILPDSKKGREKSSRAASSKSSDKKESRVKKSSSKKQTSTKKK